LINLNHSCFLFNDQGVLNLQLLYLSLGLFKILAEVVNHTSADLKLSFIHFLVFQKLFNLKFVEPDVVLVLDIISFLDIKTNTEVVKVKRLSEHDV